MTKKDMAAKLGMQHSQLVTILLGRTRPSIKKAQSLQNISGIGRMVWLYASPGELKNALEAVYGEIIDGRGRPRADEKE